MIALSIALALLAQPVSLHGAALPTIVWKTATEVEAEWRRVRETVGNDKKLAAIDEAGLSTWACRDTVELQALTDVGGLQWKDTVRRRSWARPSLARVLISAHATWHLEHPDRSIAVGDVAQAGCGQVDPGVLTRLTSGPEAGRLRAAATPILGIPTIRETVDASTLSDDPRRFEPGDRVMMETRLVADDGQTLLVQLRRYRVVARAAGFEDDVTQLVATGKLVHEVKLDDGLVRQTILASDGKRQVVVVRKNAKRFAWSDVSDVRLGYWLPGRPGVFPGEVRWIRSGDVWQAYELLVEGAHATHMAGRDADLSYAVADADQRFTEVPAAVDLPATWAWFETLVATGKALGTPIDRIIVGPKMQARFLKEIPGAKRSPLFADKIIRLVRGHDDHHHVRLGEPTPEADADALRSLK